MTAEAPRPSPIEEEMLARGRLLVDFIEVDGEPEVHTNASAAKVRALLLGEDVDRDHARLWLEAFSGRVPLDWVDGGVASEDLKSARKSRQRLSSGLVLAGITHPEGSVRIFTARLQPFTTEELAVAFAFNEDPLLKHIVQAQEAQGIRGEDLMQALELEERACADPLIDGIRLIRGEFLPPVPLGSSQE